MPLVNSTGNSPSPGRPTPGVVKQDKSSGGSVETTKTQSDPQRVRMSSGERPKGAAKGKQPNPEALCQPPPPPPQKDLLEEKRECVRSFRRVEMLHRFWCREVRDDCVQTKDGRASGAQGRTVGVRKAHVLRGTCRATVSEGWPSCTAGVLVGTRCTHRAGGPHAASLDGGPPVHTDTVPGGLFFHATLYTRRTPANSRCVSHHNHAPSRTGPITPTGPEAWVVGLSHGPAADLPLASAKTDTNHAGLGPTEPCSGRSRFLLSFACEWGG